MVKAIQEGVSPCATADAATKVFERLLVEHGAAIRRLVAAYELDASNREDLFQDIAAALWRALPAFRGECSERTFIYRVAHNTAITHRRRAAVRQRFVDLALAADQADPQPGPDETLSRNALRARLLASVQRLSPALRQAIVLSLEGLSNVEIANVLGVSVGAVAVRLNRARAELSTLLESYR